MYFRLQKPLSTSTAYGVSLCGFVAKTERHSTHWRGLKPSDLAPVESGAQRAGGAYRGTAS